MGEAVEAAGAGGGEVAAVAGLAGVAKGSELVHQAAEMVSVQAGVPAQDADRHLF
ncbi:hypothetical protein ACQEU3_20380 [Spirillospora sp. CA-253888]